MNEGVQPEPAGEIPAEAVASSQGVVDSSESRGRFSSDPFMSGTLRELENRGLLDSPAPSRQPEIQGHGELDSFGQIKAALGSPDALEDLLRDPRMAPIIAKIDAKESLLHLERLRKEDRIDSDDRPEAADFFRVMAESGLEGELFRLEREAGGPLDRLTENAVLEAISSCPSLSAKAAIGLVKRLGAKFFVKTL